MFIFVFTFILKVALNEVPDVFGGSSIPLMHSAGSTLFRITCDYETLSTVVDFDWCGDGLEKLQLTVGFDMHFSVFPEENQTVYKLGIFGFAS